MALKIRKVGLQDFAPGGTARIKAIITGTGGVGKSLYSSYYPLPFYIDVEESLEAVAVSLADRSEEVHAASVNGSQDMYDILDYLKKESDKPEAQRKYKTIIVDTVDTYQLKLENEFEELFPNANSKWDKPAYTKKHIERMKAKLLNLDFNIILLVHVKDKIVKIGHGKEAIEKTEHLYRISGDPGKSIDDQFALVGRIGVYYGIEEGKKVEKRGITFRATEDFPFLKDKFNVTPASGLPVTFSTNDYDQLMGLILEKMKTVPESGMVGEIAQVEHEKPVKVEDAGAGAPQ